jgi:hypothetical protein
LHCGVNLANRSNALANIHQTLLRLVVQGEAHKVPGEVIRNTLGIRAPKVRFEWNNEPKK